MAGTYYETDGLVQLFLALGDKGWCFIPLGYS